MSQGRVERQFVLAISTKRADIPAMRTHREIVQSHGASALVRDLGSIGIHVHRTTPQRWADRNSIPGEYWKPLDTLSVASIYELAAAADDRRGAKDTAGPRDGIAA
jgi:hypothetical protein